MLETLGTPGRRKPLHGPPEPLHSPETLGCIRQFLIAQGIRSVHYYGQADAALLHLLVHIPNLVVTVMDLDDHFGSGARFFAEDVDHIPPDHFPIRPEWLNDVPFYQEGFPFEIECWIQDVPPREWQSHQARALPHQAPALRAILLPSLPPFPEIAPDFIWRQKANLAVGLKHTNSASMP